MSLADAIKWVGSVGGILSTIKLFVYDKRLTRRQRIILVAIDSTKNKEIAFEDLARHNLGLNFTARWKGSDLLAKFALDISDYETEKDDELYSHNAELLLRDMAEKGLVERGENRFRLTLKGQRWARFWSKLLPYKFSWFFIFPKSLKRVYDSEESLKKRQ